MMKKKLTLDEYMAARPIADPIHLFDCVMPCAGAEAFLVCREDTREVARPAVRAHPRRPSSGTTPFPTTRCRCAAAGRSTSTSSGRWPGVKPADVDFVETYDDYPVIVMMQLEDLGFCKKGEGPDFVRSPHASPPTARSRTTPPAASFRSARPARPAASSAWSRRCASSPAQPIGTRGAGCRRSAWSPASA